MQEGNLNYVSNQKIHKLIDLEINKITTKIIKKDFSSINKNNSHLQPLFKIFLTVL